MICLLVLLALLSCHHAQAQGTASFELAEPTDDFYGNAFDEMGRIYLATYPCGGSCHTSGRVRLPRFENGLYRVSVTAFGMGLGWSTDARGYGGNEPYKIFNEYYYDTISLKWYLARGEHYLQMANTQPTWVTGFAKVHITAPLLLSKVSSSVTSQMQVNFNATRVY